jgi:L-lysine 6-transaminase
MNAHEIIKKHTIGDGHDILIDFQKSQGSWLVDKITGRKYLDCYSQFASQAIGWNHPCLNKLNLFENATKHKIANSDMYTDELAEFIGNFSQIAPDFSHFFFVDGGTLGVENALKAAFDYKANCLHLSDDTDVNFFDVVHLKEAFHGRSGYTLSLTNTDPNKTKWFPKFNWTRIINPKIGTNTDITESASLQQAENALKKGNVAAIILETIQGEGGDNHFRESYFQGLRKLADQYNSLLIFDEVQAGMGLTGKMWAYQHYGIIPDFISFGKKTQVCGFASTNRIDCVDNVFNKSSRINSTWGGNIVDMVRFSLIKNIIEKENLVENAKTTGDYFLKSLKEISKISNVRGKGLMIAFDLDSPQKRDETMNKLEEKGMLVLKSGMQSIRLRPHLDIKIDDINIGLNIINDSV